MNIRETLEAIKVMRGYCDGAKIQNKGRDQDEPWMECQHQIGPCWDWHTGSYRVKPDPLMRPFTQDELPGLIGKVVKTKRHEDSFLITGFSDEKVIVGALRIGVTTWLLEHYEFLDGSPCGVVEVPE